MGAAPLRPDLNTSPNTSGIQAIQSASWCKRRLKRTTPIRSDRQRHPCTTKS